MNIHYDSLKPSVNDTKMMQSILAYIKRVYIMQCSLQSC